MVIQLCFAYHALKTGRPWWWIGLIMGFPVGGCLLYYWVRQVRSADIELAGCRIARTSVLLEESSDDWWLWWVPSPHIGGAPYTHFQASVWIDARACGSRAGN